MAAPEKTYDKFVSLLDSLVYNPSRRFLTSSDYINYAQMATLDVALNVGGINLIDTTTLTVANTRDYVLSNQIKKIKRAHYVKNLGAANEEWAPLEVITQPDHDFLSKISVPGAGGTDGPYLTGEATDAPKYLIFWPEINTMRIIDTPSESNATIKLWVIGTPIAMGDGVTYDGDQMETMAIVFKMAMLARVKSRETGESGWFEQQYEAACDRIRRMRSKMRQVRQIQDGRFMSTRLRSVNGAK